MIAETVPVNRNVYGSYKDDMSAFSDYRNLTQLVKFSILETFLGKWAPDGVMDPNILPSTWRHSRYHYGILCIDCWFNWYFF